MSRDSLPPVSIIIPTLNEEVYLPRLLGSLLRTDGVKDVIVVDAGSKDKTVKVAETFAPLFTSPSSLRIISPGRGLSLQRNAGARVAKHEILMFVDADAVIPQREIYAALVQSFTRSGWAVGVPHIVPVEKIIRAHVVFKLFDLTQRILLWFDQPYLGTYCLFTTQKVFHDAGGFDVSKPVTEDIDYCFRAKRFGHVSHLPVVIPVSARRFIKYGYWRVFWTYLKEGFIYVVTGRARLDKIVYPFGEHAVELVSVKESEQKNKP